jgi:serine/threonine protein kinase/class 3 adenylate cyclase
MKWNSEPAIAGEVKPFAMEAFPDVPSPSQNLIVANAALHDNLRTPPPFSTPATDAMVIDPTEKTSEILPSAVFQNPVEDLPVGLRAMPSVGDLLGPYRIEEKIGEGGMGAVYRASDLASGTPVAIKVLSRLKLKPNSMTRFRKEARLLAAVRNPYVANLIAVNEEGDFTYLVLEYIDGHDLKQLLKTSGPLDQQRALAIASDVARALIDAHEQGIIHRDIKPDNILVLSDSSSVKLTDFGIARHIDQSESLAVTQAGSMLGTPIYMSPEQCRATADVSTQSDVYSLGITLYEMVAGRPPFLSDDPMQLATMHCFETPPPPSNFNPLVSDDVSAILQKCLAKRPEDRYADAAHLLRDLDRCLRGEPSAIELHPLLPACDSQTVFDATFQWTLQSPPESLWHYVANTERLNRAIGLPAVNYETDVDAQGRVRRFGSFHLGILKIRWQEHPFEWVEGKRMGVLRQFDGGPFKWFLSTVELERMPDNRTLLRHRIRVEPRNWIGRLMVRREIDVKARASLKKIYHRIDEALQHHARSGQWIDAFEKPQKLKTVSQQRLRHRLDRLIERGVATDIASKLGEFVATGPAQEIAKIHPLSLAKRLGVDDSALVDACLVAATEGILELGWDILCPTCRVAADWQPSLKEIQSHAHCEACNIDFSTEPTDALELVFRAHDEIRTTKIGKYCIGGPGHSPHVVAQVRLSAGERMELELALPAGQYVIRGPRLPNPISVLVKAIGASSHAELSFCSHQNAQATQEIALRIGKQVLVIVNEYPEEQVVRIERTVARRDVITAAEAFCLPRFRNLFPGERITSDQVINARRITLMVTAIANANEIYAQCDDSEALQIVRAHYDFLEHQIRRHRGAVVKSIDDGVVAAFNDVLNAVDAAWALQSSLQHSDSRLPLKLNVGVHSGSAIVTTTNDRMDYFGAVARIAADLPGYADGEVVLTEAVFSDPLVSQRLKSLGGVGRIRMVDLAGQGGQTIHSFRMV